jgi:phenylacetate-CoA ligase
MSQESRAQANIPRYYRSLDFEALWREYPPPPDYFQSTYKLSSDALRHLQEVQFAKQIERAWQIPFYRRHWKAAGIAEGDIRSLDDLQHIPSFSVHDLRDSITRDPPWGDYIGIDFRTHEPLPLILQTSGGTTGLPRPMIFSPRDREVINIITGRRLYMQGVRPFDVLQVVLGLGLTNGGFAAREGIWKYSGAVPVMTGTGAQTPTRRQIELMRAWKTNFLVGFPAYLRHMGMVAREEMKIDPREFHLKGLIVHLGLDDRPSLEKLWDAPVMDTYGTNECGSIACECMHKTGMHIFEDAFLVEINDPQTGVQMPPGKRGVVYLTTLFKYAAPMIRFNTNDISAFTVAQPCPCGCTHRSIAKIFGRNDNMVKLRGVNIFPEAIGSLVSEHPDSNGEYICVIDRVNGADEMSVLVETASSAVSKADLEGALARRFKEALGVKLSVRTVEPGELDSMTGLSKTTKARRLIDKR